MVRPYKIYITGMIGLLLFITTGSRAQYVLQQAKDKSDLYKYAAAIPLYEKAYKKKQTAEAARGAADAYYKQRGFASAEKWYATLITLKDHTPDDELKYAEVLIRNGKYADARTILIKPGNNQSALVPRMIATCDSAAYWMNNPRKGRFSNVQQLNSDKSDWGAVEYDNGTVFSSDRPAALKRKQPFFRNSGISATTYGWTGDSYQHLYTASDNDSGSVSLFAPSMINGYYHTAGASFTADGQEMFFAGTRYVKKKAKFTGQEQPYSISIEIYYTRWDSLHHQWREPVAFPYNDIFHHSTGDPFISADGQTLYFTSDAAGKGLGGVDIYYSKRVNDTGWSQPVNMGEEINTPGNERTPFFDNKGNLYFASSGRAGLGALDIYKAVPNGNGHWTVTNAGTPINSSQDDFSPFFPDGYHGYFASNRPAGKGSDDIYQFGATLMLEGEVRHAKTNVLVPAAKVSLTDVAKATPVNVLTTAEGKFTFELSLNTNYELIASKIGLRASPLEKFSTIGMEDSSVIHRTLYLDDQRMIIPPAPISIDNIYYNFDRSNIRKDAIDPLDHIVQLMKEHPNWHLDITSHTDSRGPDQYNMKLSDRRAKAAMDYLVAHGISASRLSAKGYGETRLVNKCSNGVPCSAEAHQQNRRSEFKIVNE